MPTSVGSGGTEPVVPGLSAGASLAEDARRLARSVSTLLRLTEFRDRDRLASQGVTPSQLHALQGVVATGALSVNELAAHLYVDKSTACRIATGLVDRGCLARNPDPDDARSVRLSLTPGGRSLLAGLQADEERDYATLLADLDPANRAAIQGLVEQLGRSIASGVEAEGGRCSRVR